MFAVVDILDDIPKKFCTLQHLQQGFTWVLPLVLWSTKDKQNKASETPEEECWADLGVSLQHSPWLWEEKKKDSE